MPLARKRNGGLGNKSFSPSMEKAWLGLRPSFSAHVSGFPARVTTNTLVCGFHQGKPHEVRQRRQARQVIRSTLGRTWGTRPGREDLLRLVGSRNNLDFEDGGPLLTGDEEAVSPCIVCNAVEHRFFVDLLLGW
jgi:hypothetical protein